MSADEKFVELLSVLVRDRGRHVHRSSIAAARNAAHLIERRAFEQRSKVLGVENLRRFFSPLQCNYISSNLLKRHRNPNELHELLWNEHQVQIANIGDVAMRINNVVVANLPDVRFVSADDLLVLDGEDFIDACYEQILDRKPDTAGYQQYVFALSTNQLTKRQVISEIWHSAEGQAKAVVVVDGPTPTWSSGSPASVLERGTIFLVSRDKNNAPLLGVNVSLKPEDKNGFVSGAKGDFLLHGPKCYLAAGRYAINLAIDVRQGSVIVEVTGFAGSIVIEKIQMKGSFDGELFFELGAPIDLAEVRLSVSSDIASIKIERAALIRAD